MTVRREEQRATICSDERRAFLFLRVYFGTKVASCLPFAEIIVPITIPNVEILFVFVLRIERTV